jgi:hypothetical protein
MRARRGNNAFISKQYEISQAIRSLDRSSLLRRRINDF